MSDEVKAPIVTSKADFLRLPRKVKQVTVDGSVFNIKVMSGKARQLYSDLVVAERETIRNEITPKQTEPLTDAAKERIEKEVGRRMQLFPMICMLALSLSDANGNLLFQPVKADYDQIAEIEAEVMEELCDKILELNGMTEAAKDDIEKK